MMGLPSVWPARAIAASLLLLTATGSLARAQDARMPAVSIDHLGGHVYAARADTGASTVLVGDRGIVVVDPQNVAVAQALKATLDARFPDRPVLYVVHTTHRFDRASGATVFNETAELVGHERFGTQLSRERQGQTSFFDRTDRDRDGKLSLAEVTDSEFRDAVISHDRDGDGLVTPVELYRYVREPERSFSTTRTLDVGGAKAVLVHAASSSAPDAALVFFPDERLVFGTELPSFSGQASTDSGDPRVIERWTETIRSLEFDRLMTGGGVSIARARIEELGDEMAQLHRDVAAALLAGRPLAQTQDELTAAFDDERRYARAAQVASLYRTLHLVRTSMFASANMRVFSANHAYCARYDSCDTGGLVPGGAAGASLMVERVGLDVSLGLGQQYTTERQAPLYGEIMAHRDVTISALLRWQMSGGARVLGVVPRPRALAGGVSTVRTDASGVAIVRALGWVTPPGRSSMAKRELLTGWTFGADFGVGRHQRLLLPVRATRYVGVDTPTAARGVWQFDLGVRVALRQRASVR